MWPKVCSCRREVFHLFQSRFSIRLNYCKITFHPTDSSYIQDLLPWTETVCIQTPDESIHAAFFAASGDVTQLPRRLSVVVMKSICWLWNVLEERRRSAIVTAYLNSGSFITLFAWMFARLDAIIGCISFDWLTVLSGKYVWVFRDQTGEYLTVNCLQIFALFSWCFLLFQDKNYNSFCS